MSNRIYILDTNVLLNDSNAIFKFDEHKIVIPQTVLNEIDSKKKEHGEIGFNARQFSRNIDELRLKGDITKGVKLNDIGGSLSVVLFTDVIGQYLPFQDMSVYDNRILATASYVKSKNTGTDVIVCSLDTNMRILADVFGLKAEDYKNSKIKSDELYTGIQHVEIDQNLIDLIYDKGKLESLELEEFVFDEPYPNECFVFHSLLNTKQSALARYNSIMKEFNLLPQDMKTCDILPKNHEQTFALDILKDDNIKLITLAGKAGTGKTMITLASALYSVLETQKYQKILLLKPIVPMDNNHELGFLPGGLDEKLNPWMSSYSDNIEQIMSLYMKDDIEPKKKKGKREIDTHQEKQQGKINPVMELIAHGFLEFGSLEHARGRNWANTFVIIDEAQNTTKNSMKTILTRIGEGSKIVVMGDPSQIDSPYLDSKNNGLTIIQDLFKSQDIAGHVTLTKSERSKLAELASDLIN